MSRLLPVLWLVAGAVMLVGIGWPALSAAAQGREFEPMEPTISVVGEGIVTASPGAAVTTFGVETMDESLAAALRQAAESMDRVISTLLARGVRREDIKTIRFQVAPQYERRERAPLEARLVGYRVSNAVQVRTSDIQGLGEVIDSAVAAGAVRVEGIAFEAADPAELKRIAREEAMKNARAKAEQLTSLAGVTLGRPLRIQESDTGGVVPVQVARAALPAAADAATPIEPGLLQVRTQVHIVYAFQ